MWSSWPLQPRRRLQLIKSGGCLQGSCMVSGCPAVPPCSISRVVPGTGGWTGGVQRVFLPPRSATLLRHVYPIYISWTIMGPEPVLELCHCSHMSLSSWLQCLQAHSPIGIQSPDNHQLPCSLSVMHTMHKTKHALPDNHNVRGSRVMCCVRASCRVTATNFQLISHRS